MNSTILVSDSESVRTITLNRPERRNALTPEMQHDLVAALVEAERSPSVRVVVLTGAGEAFCAGLDLAAMQAMAGQSAAELENDACRIAHMFRTLYNFPLPTIAVVNGHAVAGGTGLATLCDFTLAVPAAKFGYTEVKVGFVPALVSAYLVLQVGEKRARELLLTGRLFSAEEAYRIGLVTEVVDAESMTARVESLTATLLANSPSSLHRTKTLLSDQNQSWLDAAVAFAMDASAQSRGTHDFREGIAAFLEKREPKWNS